MCPRVTDVNALISFFFFFSLSLWANRTRSISPISEEKEAVKRERER